LICLQIAVETRIRASEGRARVARRLGSRSVHLELERDTAKSFPPVDDPVSVTSARVWMCKYRSLAPLAALTNLRVLEIANYPDPTLDPLASLSELEELRILHLPKVDDLAPLSRLVRLHRLALATLPGWDASGKVTQVHSLDPITQLPSLERLELYGVVPPDRSVESILQSRSLREVRVSKYPRAEVTRLLPVWFGPSPPGLSH